MNNELLTNLMGQQNQLLEQQNRLLQKLCGDKQSSVNEMLLPGEEVFVEDLFRDEIRDGFVVTAQRKRLWNIQLNLITEVARICEKHNIRWFAYGGTLLGATRHKGFIPWDDDVDLAILRPDYERFKAVVKEEVKASYFVDAWYDYKLEEEEPEAAQDKSFLQLVKRDQRKNHPTWWPFWPMIKLKDSRTAFIQYFDRPHVHQGIFIDIFPLDPVPPFKDKEQQVAFEIEREILFATALPDVLIKTFNEKPSSVLLTRDELESILSLNHREKAAALDSFAQENFSPSEFVGQLYGHCLADYPFSFALKNYDEAVYLPFEKMEIPVPVGYEDCLTTQYDDWRKIVVFAQHAKISSADFSYRDFFDSVKFV